MTNTIDTHTDTRPLGGTDRPDHTSTGPARIEAIVFGPTPAPLRAQGEERATASPYPALFTVAHLVVWVVWALIAFTAAVLCVAFVFRIGGANPDAPFVDWIYRGSDRAMRPFRGIFPSHDLGGQSVFDASLLFGAVAYVVAAIGVDSTYRWVGMKAAAQQDRKG